MKLKGYYGSPGERKERQTEWMKRCWDVKEVLPARQTGKDTQRVVSPENDIQRQVL